MSDLLFDSFVNTKPGDPYRLFAFGDLYKGGKKRTITREYAATFKLPHFKPPIKLGSHDEATPAGGQIVGLEVRDDGLYAIPEMVASGERAMLDGAYRYHSPEVIWDDGALEDPKTGRMLNGPLIVGDALLHTPHLGEDAALYWTAPQGAHMETVTVPTNFFERLLARFTPEPAAPPPAVPPPANPPDQLTAIAAERDDFKTKYEQLQADATRKAAIATLAGELQNKERFGSMYVELRTAEEAATVLSGMTVDQRDWCMKNFTALNAQIKESALMSKPGAAGAGAGAAGETDDPRGAFHAAVLAKAAAAKVGYNAAIELVKAETPDLFTAAFGPK